MVDAEFRCSQSYTEKWLLIGYMQIWMRNEEMLAVLLLLAISFIVHSLSVFLLVFIYNIYLHIFQICMFCIYHCFSVCHCFWYGMISTVFMQLLRSEMGLYGFSFNIMTFFQIPWRRRGSLVQYVLNKTH